MKKIISKIIAVATFGFILYVLYSKFGVIKTNFLEHRGYFLLVALAYLCGNMLDGIKLKMLLSKYGLEVGKYETFGLSLMSPLYGLIFPNAGTVTNALYLKSKYSFKFRHFITVGIIRAVFNIMLCGVIGATASVIYSFRNNTTVLAQAVFLYLAIMMAALLFFVIPIPNFLKKYKLFSKLEESIKGVEDIKSDKVFILNLGLLEAGSIITFLARYYLVFKALSLDAPLLSIAAVIPMTMLSNLISLAPSNLGIREVIVTAGSVLVGYSMGQGFLVASVDRVIVLTTMLVTGGWFFLRLKYYEHAIKATNVVNEKLSGKGA